jgi:hypothetical protein
MFIRVKVSGPRDAVVPAFTQLGNDARARGLRVFVEDPASLAMGDGKISIELPNVDDAKDGRAAVGALIDQIPGGERLFTMLDDDVQRDS